jgi:hypothetical protein
MYTDKNKKYNKNNQWQKKVRIIKNYHKNYVGTFGAKVRVKVRVRVRGISKEKSRYITYSLYACILHVVNQ